MVNNTNVVVFPREKIDGAPPQSLDEVINRVENIKKQVADVIAEEVVGNMFKNLHNYKIVVKEKDSPKFMKDVSMIVEGIRAGVYRSLGFQHPLHGLSEKIFEFKGENEVYLNIDALVEDDKKDDGKTTE